MGRRYNIKGKPKAYVERNKKGQFKKWTNKKRAVKADRRTKARAVVRPGYGHRGDQKRRG